MKADLRMCVAGLALMVGACGEQPANESAAGNAATATSAPVAGAVPPPAGTTWVETVSKTPEGGFLVGNPDAKVKLVEYASFTCHICKDFAEEGMPPLREKYISTGQVSLEFRNYVRDPIDVSIGLLVRCQGPGPHNQLTEQAFAEQTAFVAKFDKVTQAEQQQIGTLPPAQQFAELARIGGIDAFFRARGLPAARQSQCFADEAALNQLIAMRDAGAKRGITGTPMFLLNGELLPNASSWERLEPAIREALAS